MVESKTTLLKQFIQVQEKQFELDKVKKEHRELGAKVRKLAQEIPNMLRTLNLK